MHNAEHTIYLFVDYDNLRQPQRSSGVLHLTNTALLQLSVPAAVELAKCEVRLYGGWYEGTSMTPLAQTLSVEVHGAFPTIIYAPTPAGRTCRIATTADLALAMLHEPGHLIFDTFRRKAKPANVRVHEPTAVGCLDGDCVLPLMRRLLKTGSCPKHGCAIAPANLVYRNEQKLVDTMLCCDLLHAASTGLADHIVLISDDDDFLPPIRSLLARGMPVTRVRPKPNRPGQPIVVGSNKLAEALL